MFYGNIANDLNEKGWIDWIPFKSEILIAGD